MVGAHLSGMALNGELQALGGRLLEESVTAPDYRLYALDTTPPKPGMLRVEPGAGAAIKLELWALSAAAFGKFVAAIPPPLSIGTIRLADGRGVKGFHRRARRRERRARHLLVRRLARVRDASRRRSSCLVIARSDATKQSTAMRADSWIASLRSQ